ESSLTLISSCQIILSTAMREAMKRNAKAMKASAPNQANPFKPGAGHSPPCLAGREAETKEFGRFLSQEVVTQNVVLTGLRGVGKTVLMDDVYRPLALGAGWVWVGSDFSESAFVDEAALCSRLLTDLAVFTNGLDVEVETPRAVGFKSLAKK